MLCILENGVGLKKIVGILTEGLEGSEGRSWLKLWGSNDGRSPSIDPIGKEKNAGFWPAPKKSPESGDYREIGVWGQEIKMR